MKTIDRLILNACEYWESKGNKVPLFTVKYRRTQYQGSTGTTYSSNRIILTLGRHSAARKLLALHELAHVLSGDNHTPKFWTIAWDLYRWAHLPINYCKQLEGNYKKGALIAYRQMKGFSHE